MIHYVPAQALMSMAFPPLEYVVDNLLPYGLSILAGAPKVGKSWMALQLGYAVATGESFLGRQTIQGDVLYMALEDNLARIQRRLLTQVPGTRGPERLTFATSSPKLLAGLIEDLEDYLKATPGARLVIVDTYGRIQPTDGNTSKSDYNLAVDLMAPLQDLALKYNVAMVLVHHTRKQGAGGDRGDPFERILGSQGQTGTADTGMVMESDPGTGQAQLYVRGRDVEQQEFSLQFSTLTCCWELSSPAMHTRLGVSHLHAAIIGAVSAGHHTPADIKRAIGNESNSVQNAVRTLAASGHLVKSKQGNYDLSEAVRAKLEDTFTTVPDHLPAPSYVSESGESADIGGRQEFLEEDFEFDIEF